MSETDARIEALEIRIAYQDEAIETLNRTVTEQWALLERLRRELNQLTDRVREAETRAPTGAPEPPPPHY
jgi:SlyX protein